MISVSYVAPLGHSAPRKNSCHIDPYVMLATRSDSCLYVVETEGEWSDAKLSEGDLLIVDEDRRPQPGDIGLYGVGRTLYACRVHMHDGMLCPMQLDARGDEHHIVFTGTVVRMVRYL